MIRRPDMLRVGCLSFPDGCLPGDEFAAQAETWVGRAALDVLITSELPFGDWLPERPRFDEAAADRACELHEIGLGWVSRLPVPVVASSRATRGTSVLRNEAIVSVDGKIVGSHHKQFLPQQDGWFEATWFEPGVDEPIIFEKDGVNIGVLLCTEAMFPEQARRLGLMGADLIAVPRATGNSPIWSRALAMAAISAGASVVSANRSGSYFGGRAIACSSDGEELPFAGSDLTVAIVEIELAPIRAAKSTYPRDVFAELQYGAGERAALFREGIVP